MNGHYYYFSPMISVYKFASQTGPLLLSSRQKFQLLALRSSPKFVLDVFLPNPLGE